MPHEDKSSGIIGEYFAICEILRNGLLPLVPPNPVNKGFDIAVWNRDHLGFVRLQVKAVNFDAHAPGTNSVLSGDFSAEFDFLVIVVIQKTCPNYRLFVVPKSKIKDSSESPTKKGGLPANQDDFIYYTNETIPFSTFEKKMEKDFFKLYKDNWDRVKQLLEKRSKQMSARSEID